MNFFSQNKINRKLLIKSSTVARLWIGWKVRKCGIVSDKKKWIVRIFLLLNWITFETLTNENWWNLLKGNRFAFDVLQSVRGFFDLTKEEPTKNSSKTLFSLFSINFSSIFATKKILWSFFLHFPVHKVSVFPIKR